MRQKRPIASDSANRRNGVREQLLLQRRVSCIADHQTAEHTADTSACNNTIHNVLTFHSCVEILCKLEQHIHLSQRFFDASKPCAAA